MNKKTLVAIALSVLLVVVVVRMATRPLLSCDAVHGSWSGMTEYKQPTDADYHKYESMLHAYGCDVPEYVSVRTR